jgi:hypothetical protein
MTAVRTRTAGKRASYNEADVKKATAPLAAALEYMNAFDARLHAIHFEYPRVSVKRVRDILFPGGLTPYEIHDWGRQLRMTNRLLTIYAEAHHLERELKSTAPRDIAKRQIALERNRARLQRSLDKAKLGKSYKWDAWPDAIWEMTPAELSDAGPKYKRYQQPQRWEYVGDRAADLAEYLTRLLPGERGRGLGRVKRDDPLPYKQLALILSAELVTLAYRFPYFPNLQLKAGDVKSRIQRRRSRGI